MIKKFCDRCGKECKELNDVKIPNIKGSQSFSTKTVQLCRECKCVSDDLCDKLVDIHFLLFRDFIKEGAE